MQTPNPQSQGWQHAPREAQASPQPQQPQGWPAQPQAQQAQPQPPVEQPLLLGRYRIVETRGAGGFARVYVCWDVRLERKVAIKCMPLAAVAGASAQTLSEALEEARITSRLTHPNIVTVHDFELADNVAYLIMEYVDGLTLAELMARVEGGVLTYDECAHLLSSLAGALAFAHDNGVLHLDIKPSNVFIDTSANVKLGDFGMASLASAAGWEGARGGTVGYMPPEQLECGIVDERTDVFALAVVCYQALTGSCPFLAADAESSLKRIRKGALPLSKVEDELAGPVSDEVSRALSYDPAGRPATATEFARRVLPYLGDEQDGRESVQDLMAQTTGATGPNDEAWEQAARVRAIERWPWLGSACARAATACTCTLVALPLAPRVAETVSGGTLTGSQTLLASLAFGAVALLSPRAGGVLSCALMVAALASCGVYSAVFLVVLLVAALLVAWWARVGAGRPLSSLALLAPTAAATPSAGAAICGASLAPTEAALTGALGPIVALVADAAATAASGEDLIALLLTSLAAPRPWIVAAGCALGAWLAALIGRGRGLLAAIIGQAACAAVVIAAQLVAIRVENDGIWDTQAIACAVVALICSLLMSIAAKILGPVPHEREGE